MAPGDPRRPVLGPVPGTLPYCDPLYVEVKPAIVMLPRLCEGAGTSCSTWSFSSWSACRMLKRFSVNSYLASSYRSASGRKRVATTSSTHDTTASSSMPVTSVRITASQEKAPSIPSIRKTMRTPIRSISMRLSPKPTGSVKVFRTCISPGANSAVKRSFGAGLNTAHVLSYVRKQLMTMPDCRMCLCSPLSLSSKLTPAASKISATVISIKDPAANSRITIVLLRPVPSSLYDCTLPSMSIWLPRNLSSRDC
mmetsp:Transcript_34687/g.68022  ORF Transcript_34687/g.68022 Transcript_34687/m.68022 type:complete len:253 (-) Transcript_34687:534-1292(-)